MTEGKKCLTVGVRLGAPASNGYHFCGADQYVFGVCAEDTCLTPTLVRPLALHTKQAKCLTSAVSDGNIISPILSTLSDTDRKQRLAERLITEPTSPNSPDSTTEYHLEEPAADTFVYSGAVIGVVCDLSNNSLQFYLNDNPLRVTSRAEARYDLSIIPSYLRTVSGVGDIFCMPVPAAPSSTGKGEELVLRTAMPYFAYNGCDISVQFDNNWQPPPPPLPPPPPASD